MSSLSSVPSLAHLFTASMQAQLAWACMTSRQLICSLYAFPLRRFLDLCRSHLPLSLCVFRPVQLPNRFPATAGLLVLAVGDLITAYAGRAAPAGGWECSRSRLCAWVR